MRINLSTGGLLNHQQLNSWVPEKRKAIRNAVTAAMKTVGKEIAEAGRQRMKSVFNVRTAGFTQSLKPKVYSAKEDQFPALKIGSKIPWLGLHVRGGTITGKQLIPLLPEHQRMGRKAFARVIDGLMRSGNAFFIQKNGKVILMAENIKENATQLRRFKRAERQRSGSNVKRGQDIPIAILVLQVKLKARFDLPGIISAHLPRLSAEILRRVTAAL